MQWAASRVRGTAGTSRSGLLFASGLITGEALMGIALAVPVVILKQFDIALPLWDVPFGALFGAAMLAAAIILLYRQARQP